MTQTNRIKIAATANTPVEKVWKAWNTPSDIMQWNSADPSWHCPVSENDLRTGGKFKNRMEAKDGSFGFDFEGTYDKVEPRREISYTMSDGRKATTLFSEENAKLKLKPPLTPKRKTILNSKNRDGRLYWIIL